MTKNLWTYLRGDKGIWVIVLILSVFSLLAIYSSTGTLAYKEQHGNTEYYVLKHFLLLCFGLVIMYVAHNIKYVYYSRISQLLLIIAIPALIYALFFAAQVNDAGRWIALPGINLSFQPSDIAKLALVMYIARILAKEKDRIKERGPFLHILGATFLVCGLIFPANFSTSALVFLTAIVMMFIGQIKMRYIFSTLAVCVTGLLLMGAFMVLMPKDRLNEMGRMGTWAARIERFAKPGEINEDFQAEQAKIAIASGGLLGKMPGNSTQRNILPHPYSDFIYAIIIEEYGFVGGLGVLMLYIMLMFRAVSISRKCEGTFGSYLVLGIAFLLVVQAFVNMAVAVGLIPVTGQVLPFLSMGGTSLWLTSLGVGIMLSVSVDVQLKGENIDIAPPQTAEEIAQEMGIENN
ncbi:MAG: FtsW/RodA/SpoVE family cell cycle protein [Bacteroidales bacterium]|jgi:cell division protein FtsW|nr:FtsW/RodA/SpoVE family cell cycle protein [Bacteroidales bacterium]